MSGLNADLVPFIVFDGSSRESTLGLFGFKHVAGSAAGGEVFLLEILTRLPFTRLIS